MLWHARHNSGCHGHVLSLLYRSSCALVGRACGMQQHQHFVARTTSMSVPHVAAMTLHPASLAWQPSTQLQSSRRSSRRLHILPRDPLSPPLPPSPPPSPRPLSSTASLTWQPLCAHACILVSTCCPTQLQSSRRSCHSLCTAPAHPLGGLAPPPHPTLIYSQPRLAAFVHCSQLQLSHTAAKLQVLLPQPSYPPL